MTAQPGDIVLTESGLRWVVLELTPGENAWLIRPSDDGRSTGLLKGSGLTVVESPSFQNGDRCTVNGFPGAYQGTEDGVVSVLLDARSMPTKKPGVNIGLDPSVARINVGWFVLENRF
ncbi:hypothetical protein ACVDG8_023205 [Mesorhizobium sp. ORM8.1]